MLWAAAAARAEFFSFHPRTTGIKKKVLGDCMMQESAAAAAMEEEKCNFRFTVIFIIAKKRAERCQEPPQFHFKELQSKNPWPTLLGNDFAWFCNSISSFAGSSSRYAAMPATAWTKQWMLLVRLLLPLMIVFHHACMNETAREKLLERASQREGRKMVSKDRPRFMTSCYSK